MASQVEICNLALQRLGKTSITSITSNNENARQCNTNWETSVQEVLSESNWSWATKTETLALTTDESLDFDYCYQLPTDFIKIIKLYDSDKNIIDKEYYQVISRNIETDYETVTLKYIYYIENIAYFPPLFVKAFILKLAHNMCNLLTSNTGLQDRLLIEYKDALSDAILSDRKQRKNIFGKQSGSWILSR